MSIESVTRVVRVAGGRFAPGHLGELTRQVPFELVDAALAETGKIQKRVRGLPARSGSTCCLPVCSMPTPAGRGCGVSWSAGSGRGCR
ncbi:hypothetical protein E0504_36715 [Parafrankia sp. BMG5.11]|nr:hypothetical protein E0504_36715 [Parafrankia sp. BMG5.11]